MKEKQARQRRLVMFRQWSNKKFSAFNSLKKIVKICTLALVYGIIAKPVNVTAQSSDTTGSRIMELDEVTVQSTLIDLKNAETGRSIDVINGAQIQSLPVTTLDELLRYIPGIDAQQRGAFGAQTDFSLRGSNFNQVLVLIDGQKINDPLTAHFNSNIPISPTEIERIEVIHGPASLEYGPDATGGVINIITKTFSKNQQLKGLHGDAKLNYGQYNLINTSDGIYYGNDKFRISGGYLLNKSDGNPLSSGLKNFFNINSTSLAAQLQINNNWSAAYRFANDYRNFNAQHFYTDYPTDEATEKVSRYRQQFQLTRNEENYSTQILASYIKTNDYYLYAPGSNANDNNSGDLNIKAQQSVKFSSTLKSLFGINYDERSVISNDRGNHSLNHFGGFVTISSNPLENLYINGGVREDYDQNYGAFFLPQIGISYKITNPLNIRATFGRSVREADFTENYTNNYAKDSVKFAPAIGNRNLLPEKSWNSEVGGDYKIAPGILFNVTEFYRQTTDLIDYVLTSGSDIHIPGLLLYPNTQYWYAENNSKTNTIGTETRLSVNQKIFNAINLKFTGGYTFLHIVTNYENTPKYLSLQPKHLVNGDVSANYGPVFFNINGIYKVRNPVYDANLNLNLKTSYMVWNTDIDVAVYKRLAFISMAVYNIFDEQYSDFFGAQMPGRWITGGIKIKF
jgi:iron complex outermembrane receptor protein